MTKKTAALASFAVSDGALENVSLITGGVEALGHELYIDEKSIDGVVRCLLGKSLKSYLKHEGAWGDRIGQEIGFFSGCYRDGMQVRASKFEFLDAFKREAPALYEKLMEMAQKAPDQFGVSLVVEYSPVWVMADGTEVQCSPDAEDESAPVGALREYPSMRVSSVLSGDLVSAPAANPNGLLSTKVDAGESKEMALASIETAAPVATAPAVTVTEPVAAAAVLEAQPDAKIAELSATHAAALAAKDAELTTLRGDLAKLTEDHKATLAKLEDEQCEEIAAIELEAAAAIEAAEKLSADKLGVRPLEIASRDTAVTASTTAGMSDQQKWDKYSELLSTDAARAKAFYDANLSRNRK